MTRKRFVYDIETDGLLQDLTKIHSLVMWDLDAEELLSFRNDGHPDNLKRLEEGVRLLNDADLRVGHNIINFDEPALAKLFPFFAPNVPGRVLDTIILTRLIWANIKDSDLLRVKRGTLPGKLIGSHSLEAWGYRLGEWKGDYSKEFIARLLAEGWDKKDAEKEVWRLWSPEMQDYCEQDVRTNLAIYRRCQQKGFAKAAVWDEMDMAILCQKIEENGYPFDEAKAGALYASLAGQRAQIEDELRQTFGLWVEQDGAVKTPKASNAAQGYWGKVEWLFPSGEPLGPEDFTPKGQPKTNAKKSGAYRTFEGFPYTPIKIIEFSPTSRHHIANRLKALYGWKPEVFTPSGEPKLDDEVVKGLDYPTAPLLLRYFTIVKRLGQLAEGKQAWLALVRDGKIHGRYNTVGAVTRRATHSNPNIGQVPGATFVKKEVDGIKKAIPVYGEEAGWGTECRELFGVPSGWWQVGTDASGLELRCLAHFMGRWDGGAYGDALLNGDIHTMNQEAAGLPTRDMAKTFIYGFLYGAGDAKIGSIVGGDSARGKLLRETFLSQLPALGELVKAVKHKAKLHKHLSALDGGLLHVRSDHAALNTLLQSAGALICKKWGVMIERELLRRGYRHGWDGDFAFMAWVHDEYQIAARTKEIAHEIGEVSLWAIKQVEKHYSFRCPLDAEYKIGKNWAECH